MTFQSTVNVNLGFGVPGDILFDAPQRAENLIVNSSGATNNVGYAYTKSNSTNIATVGGTVGTGIVFAGIMVNSKELSTVGTSTGALTPTLAIPDNSQADFLQEGIIVVQSAAASNIGDQVEYNLTTGAISTVAPGAAATSGYAIIAGASVVRYANAAAGLIAIHLNS